MPSRRRGEPLAAVERPAAVAGRLGAGERGADVGPAGELGHPLPAGPEPLRVPAGEPRHGPLDQRGVARVEQRPRGAVGHGQRAGVDVGGRVEQVDQGELVDPRPAAVGLLVGERGQPEADGEGLRVPPQRRRRDPVDPVAPGVPGDEHRFVAPLGQLAGVQVPAGQLPELVQLGLDPAQHLRRHQPAQEGAQHGVVAVLVAEPRRGLDERRSHGQQPRSHPGTGVAARE